MSLFEYLEKLRGKPERERRRIAVIAVSIITGIIIVGWASSLSFQNPERETQKGLGPLQVIGKTFGAGVKGIKESVKSQFENMTATSTYTEPEQ